MIDGGKHFTVKTEYVEIQHYRRIRPIGAGMNGPFMQLPQEIPFKNYQ
jgi:hypothetical protein